MRREERVTVQGPVQKQQPDGMSHRGSPPPSNASLTACFPPSRPVAPSTAPPPPPGPPSPSQERAAECARVEGLLAQTSLAQMLELEQELAAAQQAQALAEEQLREAQQQAGVLTRRWQEEGRESLMLHEQLIRSSGELVGVCLQLQQERRERERLAGVTAPPDAGAERAPGGPEAAPEGAPPNHMLVDLAAEVTNLRMTLQQEKGLPCAAPRLPRNRRHVHPPKSTAPVQECAGRSREGPHLSKDTGGVYGGGDTGGGGYRGGVYRGGVYRGGVVCCKFCVKVLGAICSVFSRIRTGIRSAVPLPTCIVPKVLVDDN